MKTFTVTSGELYDRHHYKLVLKSGKAVVFECYEQLKYYHYMWKVHVDYVEVIDAKRNDSSGTGF